MPTKRESEKETEMAQTSAQDQRVAHKVERCSERMNEQKKDCQVKKKALSSIHLIAGIHLRASV